MPENIVVSTLLLILDGMEDTPHPDLSDGTPFQRGKGVGFQQLEKQGKKRMLSTIPSGCAADTMAGVLTLLGVAPEEIPKGRSSLEALALGLSIGENDAFLRGNLVLVDEEQVILPLTAEVPTTIFKRMVAVLKENGMLTHVLEQNKVLLQLPQGKDHLEKLKTLPPHQQVGRLLEETLPCGNALGEGLAALTRRLCHEFFPYTLGFWGESVKETFPQFSEMHKKQGVLIGQKPIVLGIGKALGMDLLTDPSFTGDVDTPLGKKLAAAREAMKSGNHIVLHINGTDEISHRFDPRGKGAFIHRIDNELLTPLLPQLADYRLVVTSDHWSISATGEHASTPVRVWVYGNKAKEFRQSLKPDRQRLRLFDRI